MRYYVIAILSNLGYRCYDQGVAGTADFQNEDTAFSARPCAVHFTQSLSELSRRVDELLKQRPRDVVRR